jgi:hypothetical protein
VQIVVLEGIAHDFSNYNFYGGTDSHRFEQNGAGAVKLFQLLAECYAVIRQMQ